MRCMIHDQRQSDAPSGQHDGVQWCSSACQRLTLICAVLVVWDCAGCKPESRPSGTRALTLIVSGDTAGWIVPCGCASNQSGGLLRRGSFVAQTRDDGPTIVVDVGGAPAGTSPYDEFKFQAALKGEVAMGYSVHNLGGSEVALGLITLSELHQEFGLFVSANVRDADDRTFVPTAKIINSDGHRVLVTGVLSNRYNTHELRILDAVDSLIQVLADHDDAFDAFIVLAYMPEEELLKLAEQFPEADAIIGGPTGQSVAPHHVGPVLVASATNKGKFLVQMQRAAHGWDGTIVEMDVSFTDDIHQQKNLKHFHQGLAEHDFSAMQSGLGIDMSGMEDLPSNYTVAGSDACIQCHESDCRIWGNAKHAHAWDTLKDSGSHVDPYCQQCHTTGYGLPMGFQSVKQSPDRTDVGCESCHGPSQAHMLTPTVRTPYTAADQCIRCHDRDHSPNYEYDVYWSRIMHGDNYANNDDLKESAP